VVEGVAKRADGTPIDVRLLDAGEFRFRLRDGDRDARFRATPDVVRAGSAAGTFEMVYKAPYAGRNEGNPPFTQEERRLALLNQEDGHMIGFGHVEPPPGDVQMIEGFGTAGGAADGCDGAVIPPGPAPEPEPADTVRPTVVQFTPALGSTRVARNTDVTVRFDEPVKNVTQSTVKLVRASTGRAVAVSVTLNAAKTVATVDPVNLLRANTKYRVMATTGVTDLAGNALVAKNSTFTTRR